MPRDLFSGQGGDVQVAWTRDHCTIELATTVPGAVERICAILAEGGLKLVDAATGALPGTAQLGNVAELLQGWHVHLIDRSDVNRLIRTLKGARDQAFGKDE